MPLKWLCKKQKNAHENKRNKRILMDNKNKYIYDLQITSIIIL